MWTINGYKYYCLCWPVTREHYCQCFSARSVSQKEYFVLFLCAARFYSETLLLLPQYVIHPQIYCIFNLRCSACPESIISTSRLVCSLQAFNCRARTAATTPNPATSLRPTRNYYLPNPCIQPLFNVLN